jgi:hypothetical protein
MLAALVSLYGLPLNEGFEAACGSIFLPETHNRARARSKFFDWITKAADHMPNMVRLREKGQGFESKVTVTVRAESCSRGRLWCLLTYGGFCVRR